MKEHNIPRLDLTTINPEARENIETIGHDLAVFDDFGGVPVFEYPSRINLAVLSLCLSGEASASINLKEYTFRTNDMLILMPGQIVQRHGESDDFTGCAIRHIDRFRQKLAAGNPAVPARFSATQGRSVPAPESGRSRPDTGVPLVPPAENEAEKPPLPA